MTDNVNCLEGMRCPDCGQNDSFNIVGTAEFDVSDDGTGSDFTDVEWHDDSKASCPDCGWHGTVGSLRREVSP